MNLRPALWLCVTVAILSPVLRADEPSAKPSGKATSVDRKAFEEAKRKLAQKQRARKAEAEAAEREQLRKADAQLRSENERLQASPARQDVARPQLPITRGAYAHPSGVNIEYYIRIAPDLTRRPSRRE